MDNETNEQKYLRACYQNKVNVEVLVGLDDSGSTAIGVRLRPWGNKRDSGRMALGSGNNFYMALKAAMAKAAAGRWEELDFAARPWDRPGSRTTATWEVE